MLCKTFKLYHIKSYIAMCTICHVPTTTINYNYVHDTN